MCWSVDSLWRDGASPIFGSTIPTSFLYMYNTTLPTCISLWYTSSNNGAVAKLLIDGGADVNIRDDRGVSPLATAAGCGHLEVVQVLLDHPKTDPDIQVIVCPLCAHIHVHYMLHSAQH